MEQQQILQVASELIISILEQNLFLFADPIEQLTPPEGDPPYLKVRMGFYGDINGYFVMLFPEETSKEIIANFLGLEQDSAEMINLKSHDAASEIMNIIGGNIISRMLHEKGTYNLEIPSMESFETLHWQEFIDSNHHVSFMIDGRPICFQIIVN